MDNLSDQMGILSDDFIEECSEDSDDHSQSKTAPLREQDRFLPIANIAKIMKRAIPENGKVSATAIIQYFTVIDWFHFSRLRKKRANASKNVYRSSYHSLRRRQANDVKMKNEKQSTEKIFCMQCVHSDLTTMLTH